MRNTLLLVLLFVSVVAFPLSLDVCKAKQIVVQNFANTEMSIVKLCDKYCVFNKGLDEGYIIVCSNDEGDVRVLGYSDSGSWDEDKVPKLLLDLLESIEQESSDNRIIRNKSRSILESQIKEDIPSLLTTKWHQYSPYNDMSPIVVDGNIKSLAGCVAIAASQIIFYWHKDNPSSTLYDTPTYSYGKAPVTQSIPAGTSYQWNLIKDSYKNNENEDDRKAVAQLVYIVGTSAWLHYSATGTGGQINDLISPFYAQFRLNPDARYCLKKKYSQEEWEQLLYDNLKKKQPILYSGNSGSGGHAVVIDGYDARLNLFHFNFGWGGDGDGYYTVDDITGMNGYNNSQACVCDIFPMERNISIIDNSPDLVYRNSNTDFSFAIENNSTLSLHELHYFLSDITEGDFPQLDKEKTLYSFFSEIPNNGKKQNISVSICPDVNAGDYNLILTDENLRILKKKEIKIIDNTAIYGVKNDESCELVLRKNGCNTLLIETKTPTIITIYTVDGKKIFSNIINGKFERVLPKGLYIINNKLWLQ